MALADDFRLHLSIHTEGLQTLRNGVPSGLTAQLAEMSTVLTTYDVQAAKIQNDTHLSPEGKAERLRAAHDQAQTAIEKWTTARTTGIDAQIAAHEAKLQSHADKLLPTPTEFQIQNMAQRLSAFDPLEVEMLYADATDAERRIIEAAADAIGRQPLKRGEQLVWEPLVMGQRVDEVREARLQQADPVGFAALRDLERIRTTYVAVAGGASGLLRESVPMQVLEAPATGK